MPRLAAEEADCPIHDATMRPSSFPSTSGFGHLLDYAPYNSPTVDGAVPARNPVLPNGH